MWLHSLHDDGTACKAAHEDVCVALGFEDLETGKEAMTCFLEYSSCCFVGLERLTTDMVSSRTTVAVALQSFGVSAGFWSPLFVPLLWDLKASQFLKATLNILIS